MRTYYFFSKRIFLSSHVGAYKESGSKIERAAVQVKRFSLNGLESLLTPDWNCRTSGVVSDWPRVQKISTILIKVTVFFLTFNDSEYVNERYNQLCNKVTLLVNKLMQSFIIVNSCVFTMALLFKTIF